MVPEYLTPTNGGLLLPGQLMGLSHAVSMRHGGQEVAALVLEVAPDVMVGKVWCGWRGGRGLGLGLVGGGVAATLWQGLAVYT